MKHSEWMQPTDDDVRELEYTQLEENNGNGVGGGSGKNTSVPINGGLVFVLLITVIYGLWKQSRISPRSTSES